MNREGDDGATTAIERDSNKTRQDVSFLASVLQIPPETRSNFSRIDRIVFVLQRVQAEEDIDDKVVT